MATPSTPTPTLIYPNERRMAAISHLMNIVPLWGLIANALIFFAWRERSRSVCFHARQGINLQILLLLLVTVKMLADILSKFVAVALEQSIIPIYAKSAGDVFLTIAYFIYAGFCFYGVFKAISGKFFLYPYIGPKLLNGYVRAGVR